MNLVLFSDFLNNFTEQILPAHLLIIHNIHSQKQKAVTIYYPNKKGSRLKQSSSVAVTKIFN